MDAFRAENTRPVVLAEATPVQCALNTHRIFKMESNQSLIRLALGPKYLNIIRCLVMWLRVRFTRSHIYQCLVTEKKGNLFW